MNNRKQLKFLCAVNDAGKFFGLDKDFATTSPFECDHPYEAEKIFPTILKDGTNLSPNLFTDIHPAWYYFENSNRMKEWLTGYKMVIIDMLVDYSISE